MDVLWKSQPFARHIGLLYFAWSFSPPSWHKVTIYMIVICTAFVHWASFAIFLLWKIQGKKIVWYVREGRFTTWTFMDVRPKQAKWTHHNFPILPRPTLSLASCAIGDSSHPQNSVQNTIQRPGHVWNPYLAILPIDIIQDSVMSRISFRELTKTLLVGLMH